MGFLITWSDNNLSEEGHRLYRSTSPMDPESLPAPIANLGPGVDSYEDGDVTPGETYYYRVGAFVGSVEMVSDELEIEAVELPFRLVYARRFSTLQSYEIPLINYLQSLPLVEQLVVLGEGDLSSFVFSQTDTLIVGPPGTDYTEHPEASLIESLELNILSFCRYTSRETLGMGTNSAGANQSNMTVLNPTHPTMLSLGWTDNQTISMGSSVNNQRVYSLTSGTNLIMRDGSTGYAGFAERIENGFFRRHLGYYRSDVATTQWFDLLSVAVLPEELMP